MTSVIIGDIINSRNSETPKQWLNSLKTVLNEIGLEPKVWEIFRGDSFQVEVTNPKKALLTALKIKAALRSAVNLDVRMAIGIGEKSYNATKITEANGDAFVRAGELFENLKKHTLALSSPWTDVDSQMNLNIELALLTIDNWTQNSAKTVQLSIAHPKATQSDLAKMLNISQSSVSERQKRAGFDEIMKMNQRYELLISQKLKEV
ncbi:SatD family protein [Owenweeksia hongkongensis]|uniref:SatD family protein n=1 Tax=Owenweeksia hongkongensis TaxID=253245 RepID=UPI003A942DF8